MVSVAQLCVLRVCHPQETPAVWLQSRGVPQRTHGKSPTASAGADRRVNSVPRLKGTELAIIRSDTTGPWFVVGLGVLGQEQVTRTTTPYLA
ncbi:hypothetical protein VTN77DRAFT_281 [Rasamsonia byssochlamydoides]|uniref:uncharacterized protein n=1 Tax=Rasamsonia byssochlamydoides TaxID=89139 RepID=UPI003742AEF6